MPGVEVPIGTSAEYYKVGGFGTFSTAYKPPLSFPLYVSAELGYSLLPFNLPETKILNVISGGAGVGIDYRFMERLALNVYARGGYYYGLTKDDAGEVKSGGNPYVWGGGELSFYLSPALSIGVGGMYRHFFGKPQSLLSSLGVYLGTMYRIPLGGMDFVAPAEERPGLLELIDIETKGIFPVFYKYYDTHPIGRATLHNEERGKIEDIRVSLFIKRYMDSPKVVEIPGELKAGEKREIDLYALFTEKVLEITEGDKVAAEINLKYSLKGAARKSTQIVTIDLEHRNASIWDDDRRAAAFVTARDPVVLKFAKSVAALVREHEFQALDFNLRTVLALHEALSLYGISYVVDPKTPYVDLVKDAQAVDFLQFPRQTLDYRAGDCDDLSILYAALLESVSVDTAFITVPEHIYIAVGLELEPAAMNKLFSSTKDFIVRDGRVWLPLEVTEVQNSFLQAWETGARLWREHAPQDQAGFFPMAEAWTVFAPVGLPGEGEIDVPGDDQLSQVYQRESLRLVEREISDKVKELKARIESSGGSLRVINSLGILYARYGLMGEAEQQFQRVIRDREYTPALINLGNIYYLRGDLHKALEFYTRAQHQSPDSPAVLVSLTQINRELENHAQAQESYAQLAAVAPDIAEDYKFLSRAEETGARAGEAGQREVLLWEE
jgi:tetratricopeptide (TPR) repeat protein